MAWRQALTRDAAISFQGEDHGVGSVPDTTAYYEEEEREADSDFEEYESNHTHVSRHLTSGALRNDVHSISKVAGSSARPPGGGGQVAPVLGRRSSGLTCKHQDLCGLDFKPAV